MTDLPSGAVPAGADFPDAIPTAPCIPEQSRADHTVTSPLDGEALRRRWELVLPHREQMLAVARRRVDTLEDAEDVVTTALIRTVEHPRLDESRVGAFLCTTVMRLAVDVHRDRARQLAVGTRDATRALPCPPVEELLCDEDEARWLAEQLQDLPERERQVLQARLSGLTAQQASAYLGLSPKATENAFTRVRQRANGLLAATLAGLGILFGGMRRLARPELALVPAAAATALVLGVAIDATRPSPPPPTDAPIVLDADTAPIPPAASPPAADPTAPISPATSAPPTPLPSPSASTATSAGPPPAPVPALPGMDLAPPDMDLAPPDMDLAPPDMDLAPPDMNLTPPDVDLEVIDPGGVAVEDRDTDETVEESAQRCVEGMDPGDPLAVPCP